MIIKDGPNERREVNNAKKHARRIQTLVLKACTNGRMRVGIETVPKWRGNRLRAKKLNVQIGAIQGKVLRPPSRVPPPNNANALERHLPNTRPPPHF